VVRERKGIKSQKLPDRLTFGSIVRELKVADDRLHYQLIHGNGPISGWVSFNDSKGAKLLISRDCHEIEGRTDKPISRLLMLPKEMRNLSKFDIRRSQTITQHIYGTNGCLTKLASTDNEKWLKMATVGKDFDVFEVAYKYPGFPAEDPVVKALLDDASLKALERVFPAPPREKRTPRDASPDSGADSGGRRRAASPPRPTSSPTFFKTLHVAKGLLPGSMTALYFINNTKTSLYGAVRFLAQSTVSMNREISQEMGLFNPSAHEGAQASLMYDAANYFARLVWRADAMPQKIVCKFLDRCPTHQTLVVWATRTATTNTNLAHQCTVNVVLKAGSKEVATAEVVFTMLEVSNMKLPCGFLHEDLDIAPPNLDWVPPELTKAQLPPGQIPKETEWDVKDYLSAAFDKVQAMQFPYGHKPVEESQGQGRMHVSANRPVGGTGNFRSDLSFPQGLAPAAMSNYKCYDDKDASRGVQFTGKAKFGPQASDAMFLTGAKGGQLGQADGSMSLAADFGLSLAVLNEFLLHLPRCAGHSKTATRMLEAKIDGLIPIGADVDLMSFFPKAQPATMAGTNQHFVRSNMECGGRLVVSATAVISSE